MAEGPGASEVSATGNGRDGRKTGFAGIIDRLVNLIQD
jgi:hypothetical protein